MPITMKPPTRFRRSRRAIAASAAMALAVAACGGDDDTTATDSGVDEGSDAASGDFCQDLESLTSQALPLFLGVTLDPEPGLLDEMATLGPLAEQVQAEAPEEIAGLLSDVTRGIKEGPAVLADVDLEDRDAVNIALEEAGLLIEETDQQKEEDDLVDAYLDAECGFTLTQMGEDAFAAYTGSDSTEDSEAAAPLSYDGPVDLGDGMQLPENTPQVGTTPFDCDALDQEELAEIVGADIFEVESFGFNPDSQVAPVDAEHFFHGVGWASCSIRLIDDDVFSPNFDVRLIELGDDFEAVKTTVQEAMDNPVDSGFNVARFGTLTTADGFFWEAYGKYNLYLRVDDLVLTIWFSPGETDPEIADLVAIAEFILRTW